MREVRTTLLYFQGTILATLITFEGQRRPLPNLGRFGRGRPRMVDCVLYQQGVYYFQGNANPSCRFSLFAILGESGEWCDIYSVLAHCGLTRTFISNDICTTNILKVWLLY